MPGLTRLAKKAIGNYLGDWDTLLNKKGKMAPLQASQAKARPLQLLQRR